MKLRGNRRISRGYIPHDDGCDMQANSNPGAIMGDATRHTTRTEDHWHTCEEVVYDIRPQICRQTLSGAKTVGV
jgi:hypothetical protein